MMPTRTASRAFMDVVRSAVSWSRVVMGTIVPRIVARALPGSRKSSSEGVEKRPSCASRQRHPYLEAAMKYVILIHANPEPWGHPTTEYTDEGRALPDAERARLDAEFEELMTEL